MAVRILLAIAVICVPIILAGGYKFLESRLGTGFALALSAGGVLIFLIAAAVLHWSRAVKQLGELAWAGLRYLCYCLKALPLIGRLHEFTHMAEELESTIRQKCENLDGLAKRSSNLEEHIDTELIKIDERIENINQNLEHVEHLTTAIQDTKQNIENWRQIVLTVFPWINHIAELQVEETRIKALQMILSIIDNSPSDTFTDEGLASVIREMGKEHFANSENSAEKELTHAIRHAAYKLDENDFRQTKMSLRNTARRMLDHGNGSVSAMNIHAFDEITRNADRWPYDELQSISHRLSRIRQSQFFADAIRGGDVSIAQAFASTAREDSGHKRVWKRVWAAEFPDNNGNWGRISCLLDNGNPCQGGELEEVSLCGATCMSCKLEMPIPRILKVILHLPCYAEPITINHAEFKMHNGCYFSSATGKRITPGFSMEFKELETEQLEKLAHYIRQRSELNPNERPPNAPQKSTAAA